MTGRRGLHSIIPPIAIHDRSTVDYIVMPKFEVAADTRSEITRIPLLPTNMAGRDNSHHETIQPTIRPQISTASADSTHIESPSAMREVADNHAIELDPFNLTSKVAIAATKLAQVPMEKANQEAGALKEFWDGLLDDLFGAKRTARS